MGSALTDVATPVVVSDDSIRRFAFGLDGGFIGSGSADRISAAATEEKAAAQNGAEKQGLQAPGGRLCVHDL